MTADAVARHRYRNATQTEQIRRAMAALEAAYTTGDLDSARQIRRRLHQLHGNQAG